MNTITLTGYIASDVELKTTQQGTSVCTLSMAVKRPKSKDNVTDFFTIVCWKNTAEFVTKYFRKGSGIEVKGILTTRKWTDKNNNNRIAVEVVAEEVDFGKKSKADEQNDNNSSQNGYEQSVELNLSDEDLPF